MADILNLADSGPIAAAAGDRIMDDGAAFKDAVTGQVTSPSKGTVLTSPGTVTFPVQAPLPAIANPLSTPVQAGQGQGGLMLIILGGLALSAYLLNERSRSR